MRIAIMGAGGVGGYCGGQLARAGHDVAFITRGEHLRAILAGGLKLVGAAGEAVIAGAQATDDPARLAPVDIVLFCVKLFDTEDAARAIVPLLSKGGTCITLQNGVDGQHRIGAIVGNDRVMGGIAFVSALIESPGVIRYASMAPSLKFGEADGRMTERAARFRDACVAAGFGGGRRTYARAVAQVRGPDGECGADEPHSQARGSRLPRPRHRGTRAPCLRKAQVAGAMGIGLPEDIVEWQIRNHQNFPPGMYASMYHDLARGRRLELDSLSGLIIRQGRELGVPTPFHSMAYACLKPYLNGSQ